MAQSIKSHSRRFVAIDANSLVHRAFHAFPPSLATSEGLQVNAVYGFTSMLLRVLDALKPKYLVCAFDLKAPTFRHTEFVDYKAHRKPTDKSLINQFPFVKDVVKSFNIPVLERKGFEADDILGTLAEYVASGKWKSDGLEIVVVSSDKDLLQLVDDNIKVWLPRGSFKDLVMYDEKEVIDLFGFIPDRIPDYKALAGDASDNIPGVKGVGPKTATGLIKKFGHLAGIYKNLSKAKPRVQTLLAEGEESAALSLKLATIVKDVDLDVKLEDCLMRDFDYNEVLQIFKKFEFRSLINKIPESLSGNGTKQMDLFSSDSCALSPADTKRIKDFSDLATMSESSKSQKFSKVVFYYSGDGSCMLGLVGKQLDKAKYYFANQDKIKSEFKALVKFLLSTDLNVISYGWEGFCRKIYKTGVADKVKKSLYAFSQNRIFDIGLASYYLSSGRRDYSLRALTFAHTTMVLPEVNLDCREYTNLCIKAVLEVAEALQKKVSEHVANVASCADNSIKSVVKDILPKVELPMALSLAEMHTRGVKVNAKGLRSKGKELEDEIGQIQSEIFKTVGHEFNIDSSKQLADVLFAELSLPVQKKIKTGYSTNESVLKKLSGMHPCVQKVLKYREKMKIMNTYVKPLLKELKSSDDGRIHTTFSQTGTSTGRLSSRNPNLQTIPTRTELGREIKRMFIADKGNILISADYSQIDLRVMAHFSKDELMLEDFASGVDFHKSTAARILDMPKARVSKQDRRLAKTINFGVLYGLSPYGLSEALEIDRKDAAKYIDDYFSNYSGVTSYIEKMTELVKKRGYVETLLGRRRYIHGVNSRNYIVRSASEREAVNMPIQGTSADIMRIAMNRVYKWILDQNYDIGFLLQIHDEFVLECDKVHVDEVKSKVGELMETAIILDVPLVVDVESGHSLGLLQ
ncbi:MAG: DNA polymerase I [Patescibacteria group bacterium]|nr:DNA polymerase I [Patescibacteria group bacterium]